MRYKPRLTVRKPPKSPEFKALMVPSDLHKVEDALAMCRELPVVQVRLRQAGLYKTAIALDAAVRSVGFETAEMIEATAKWIKRNNRRKP